MAAAGRMGGVMAGNPRDNVGKKGFWDGGSRSHGSGNQSAGRASGFPGSRIPSKLGVRVDIEGPESQTSSKSDSKAE